MRERQVTNIPALDGVRGIAILLVLVSHVGTLVTASGMHLARPIQLVTGFGFAGVDLFFVLSGFLLFLPYTRAMLYGQPLPSVRQFYVRRALRILPAYYAVLAVILILLAAVPPASMVPSCYPNLGALLSGVTLLYDMVPRGYCAYFVMDGPLWSLTVEWQFYLILPALGYLLWWLTAKRGWRHAVWYGLAGVTLFSFVVDMWATRLHYALAPDKLWVPLPWQIPYALLFGTNGKYLGAFAVGMLAALIYTRGREHAVALSRRVRWLLVGAAVAGVGGLTVALFWAATAGKITGGMSLNSIVFPIDPTQWAWGVWGDWLICASFAALVLVVLFVPVVARVMSIAPIRFMGRISYSVYLWHLLLINLYRVFTLQTGGVTPQVGSDTLGWMLMVAGIFAVIVGWGALSYFVIERPFLRAKERAHTGSSDSRGTEPPHESGMRVVPSTLA